MLGILTLKTGINDFGNEYTYGFINCDDNTSYYFNWRSVADGWALKDFYNGCEVEFESQPAKKAGAYDIAINAKIKGEKNSDIKPPLSDNKDFFMQLGYIPPNTDYLNYLSLKANVTIDKNILSNRIKNAYDKGKIRYWEYDDKGYAVEKHNFSQSRTAKFAFNTGYQVPKDHDDLYVVYSKYNLGFQGVLIIKESDLLSTFNEYYIGKLKFNNYDEANKFIKSIHEIILPGEVWGYEKEEEDTRRIKTKYDILESYLGAVSQATVKRYNDSQKKKDGVRFSCDKTKVLINTGLMNKNGLDILIFGTINPNKKISSIENVKLLKKGATELSKNGFKSSDSEVMPVKLYNKTSEIIFRPDIKVDYKDMDKLEHCIEDGIARNRFPTEYTEKYENEGLLSISQEFINGINFAVNLSKKNYKYVVPQYSPANDEIQFLMPIFLKPQNYGPTKVPDIILVLSYDSKAKCYIPETTLPVEWAYANARVICRPESWLNVERSSQKNKQ